MQIHVTYNNETTLSDFVSALFDSTKSNAVSIFIACIKLLIQFR